MSKKPVNPHDPRGWHNYYIEKYPLTLELSIDYVRRNPPIRPDKCLAVAAYNPNWPEKGIATFYFDTQANLDYYKEREVRCRAQSH